MDLEVADRGLELIVEVNHCYREMQKMKTLLTDQENKIREKLRSEYEALIRELSTKLIAVTNSNEHNYISAYQDLLGNIVAMVTTYCYRQHVQYKK